MKLKLKLHDLRVDTFETTAVKKERGTVFGEQCTCYTQCTCPGCPTCANYATCDASCNGTCDASCNGTCDYSCAGTCAYSCDCSAYSCDPTCGGFVTYPGDNMHCIIC